MNFDANQGVNLQMTRLLTSFSTVCVKNPVFDEAAQAACMGCATMSTAVCGMVGRQSLSAVDKSSMLKKWAIGFFLYKSIV